MKECNSCGKCCTKYGGQDLSVTDEELSLWEIFNPDIFAYVKNGKTWFNPNTGEKLLECPWLIKDKNKTFCGIYLDRPQDCRGYPTLISEMIADQCEMIEGKDLKDTQQAQQRLDVLMIDFRPATR